MVKPLMYFPGGPSQTKLLPNFEDIIVDPEMTQPPGVELPPGMAPLPQRKTYKPGELL